VKRGSERWLSGKCQLGKIHERKGQKEKAIVNNTKFLDLWKNADPGIPEVEDAGKRIAGLKG